MRRILPILIAAAVAVAAGACSTESSTPPTTPPTTQPTSASSDGAPRNAGVTVEIQDGFRYEPAEVTVKVNEAVTWTNDAAAKHTVTANDGQPVTFKSPTLARGETFVQTFSQPGTYQYFCSIHGPEKMKGTITVTG